MRDRTKRRRLNSDTSPIPDTIIDKSSWNGFCEIESEPTADNACASVALLNIVNNIDDITLGDTLASFKEFTMPFTPALRGDAIANFDFIKRIHNSFARSMDILNSDISLKDEAVVSKSSRRIDDSASNEAAFHFIAFVPALGRVWKFDGLERQPQDLAPCTNGDWLKQVRSHLIDKMMEYAEGQIEFSVLSLVRDPLKDYTEQLARNVRSLQGIRHRLSETQLGDIEAVLGAPEFDGVLLAADPALGLTEECLMSIDAAETVNSGDDGSLPREYLRLVSSQRGIKTSILEEMQLRRDDEAFAEGRRHDCSSAVEFWARALASKGVVKELLS
ncbi:hypothetical protein TMatcc_009899 [Talaromyces marneffei ATCC 18224]|uniref:uncharacterized protein n=1 Tax=Talaromyces marneffei TaxID=37727 RepID=UPI0012A7FD1C|nr:uncharacterized protein EYB26_009121 [Talaromyces marneffei]KAE8548061.1 hypothetical protein EYB25_009854 [Talaromyces marneffei]QGA21411.1 hypothetical protein EYB26_009121 [Talaromyces marneffei]